jgi:hypothetical protein
MKRCEECGKELGFLEGYHHPTMGKDVLVCTNCFGIVDDSVTKWREAVLEYIDFFNNKPSKHKEQIGFNNVSINHDQIKEIYSTEGILI